MKDTNTDNFFSSLDGSGITNQTSNITNHTVASLLAACDNAAVTDVKLYCNGYSETLAVFGKIRHRMT